MGGRFWLRIADRETYLSVTFITLLALFGMFSGKLDYNAGLGVIATMGLGTCIHPGVTVNAGSDTPDDGGAH